MACDASYAALIILSSYVISSYVIWCDMTWQASYAALIMSTKSVTDVFLTTIESRKLGFADLLLQFCYMSAGTHTHTSLPAALARPCCVLTSSTTTLDEALSG